MLAKLVLVISSYSPLFLLLSIRFEEPWLRVYCLGMFVLGALGLFVVLRLNARATPTQHTIRSISTAGAEASAYVASYLMPLVVDPKPRTVDLLVYALFLIIAGIVTARTGAIQVNPLLYVVGYSIFRIEDDRGLSGLLLSRARPRLGDVIWATRLHSGGELLVNRTSRR